MATKAALLALINAQLHQQIEKRGVEGITSGSIRQMVDNAIRIEDAIDAHLKTAKETK